MPLYQNTMPRPRIDIDEKTEKRVKDYAEREGLRKPRAFAELIERGLDAEEVEA